MSKDYKPLPKWRKGLSGLQASRLLLADNVEVDHGRPGILSQEQYERLIEGEGLASPRDKAILNTWKYVYRMVDITIREATVKGQEAMLTMYRECYLFSAFNFEALLYEGKVGLWERIQEGRDILTEGGSLAEELKEALSEVEDKIAFVLAALTVLEAVSDLIHVRLTEDLRELLNRIANMASLRNAHLRSQDLQETFSCLKPEEREALLLGEVRASLAHLRYFEERMERPLGKNWRKNLLKTSFTEFVFVPPEEVDNVTRATWPELARRLAVRVYET